MGALKLVFVILFLFYFYFFVWLRPRNPPGLIKAVKSLSLTQNWVYMGMDLGMLPPAAASC